MCMHFGTAICLQPIARSNEQPLYVSYEEDLREEIKCASGRMFCKL